MARAVTGCLQRAAALVCAALAVASVARAQPVVPDRDWLNWQGPIECQNTREVERQIESLLGRAPDLAQLPSTRVEVGWARERGWTLLIRVTLPHGERRRAVDVRSCADGFDVVALTLALILDPDLAGADSLAGETSANDADVAGNDDASEPASASAPPDTPASASVKPALPDRPALEEPPARPAAAQSPVLALTGSGRADLGSLPAALYGGGLELALSAWGWRLDTGAALLLRGAATLPTARYPIEYSNLLGLLRGCREFRGERGGHFGLCLGGQLGSLAAGETEGERRHARGLWAAANLGAELGVEVSQSWQAFSRVELVFPLLRHEFELAGGAVVHELPTVSVQLTLGASVELTEWASP